MTDDLEIRRSTLGDGNLYPEIFNFLEFLPDRILHHTSYSDCHPKIIYRISIGRVIDAFNQVLDELDFLQSSFISGGIEKADISSKLPALQKELLESLSAHIDDCYHILRAVYPKSTLKKTPIFVDKWLKKANHPTVDGFQDGVEPYRNSFRDIVNGVKHKHKEIHCCLIYPGKEGLIRSYVKTGLTFPTRGKTIVGYYLSGFFSDGSIGPDPGFHPNREAISFNHNLRYHFVHLYIIGHLLKNAFVDAVLQKYGLDISTQIFVESKTDEIEKLADRIYSLPLLFFPKEFEKPVANVYFFKDDQNSSLTLVPFSADQVVWKACGQPKLLCGFKVYDTKYYTPLP
jgi:hypothetical protein